MKLPLNFLDSSLKEVDPRDCPIGSRNVQADPGSFIASSTSSAYSEKGDIVGLYHILILVLILSHTSTVASP